MTAQVKQRALITGASSGIGRATALAFAQAGFDLALVGRNQQRLQAVAESAIAAGVDARTYCVDLADVAQVRSQLEAIVADLGVVDVLINNAGMGYTGKLAETCIQAVLPGMRQRGQGTIINLASVAGHQAFPDWGPYCVSKFGLVALSKTLAAEERSHGIRVITVSPGAVNTPIWDTATVHADFDRSQMLSPEVVAQTLLQAALLPQEAVIEDLTLMPSGGAF